MSKPFDYSKWDNIELSDDEDDVHPNIDKESWFRMKHRSRIEREEREAQEIKEINSAMDKANQRIKVLQHDLKKLEESIKIKEVEGAVEDDDDDDDLDDAEGLRAEINELMKANEQRTKRLQEIEKHKKWNVDNICEVKEERTIVNANAVLDNYTPTGFAKAKEDIINEQIEDDAVADAKEESVPPVMSKAKPTKIKSTVSGETVAVKSATTKVAPPPPKKKPGPASPMDTYHDFTVKYSDIVEQFMHLQSLEDSKEFLLVHGDVLLQENASNYLLLASLEDEMNGYREKMKLTCRQSQIISNIAELAKSMHTHPGNVVIPFFQRMEQKELLEGFFQGVEAFCEKIIARAVTKRQELDRERLEEEASRGSQQGTPLEQIPLEERLGPGGLDPLEVIESLPLPMQEAFESRDVEKLKQVLLAMDPEDAQYHMKRCIDSGLWNENS